MFSKNTKNSNKILFYLIEQSTFHGLAKAIQSKNVALKFIWLVCFLASFSCCSFVIIQSFLLYFNFDVYIDFMILNDIDFEFPAVTICNLNRFDYSKKEIKEHVTQYLKSLKKYDDIIDYNTNSSDLFETVQLIDADIMNMPNIEELMNKYEYSIDSMLLACTFNSKPCSKQAFKNVTKRGKRFGKCYTFNSGYNLKYNKVNVLKRVRPGSKLM